MKKFNLALVASLAASLFAAAAVPSSAATLGGANKPVQVMIKPQPLPPRVGPMSMINPQPLPPVASRLGNTGRTNMQ